MTKNKCIDHVIGYKYNYGDIINLYSTSIFHINWFRQDKDVNEYKYCPNCGADVIKEIEKTLMRHKNDKK